MNLFCGYALVNSSWTKNRKNEFKSQHPRFKIVLRIFIKISRNYIFLFIENDKTIFTILINLGNMLIMSNIKNNVVQLFFLFCTFWIEILVFLIILMRPDKAIKVMCYSFHIKTANFRNNFMLKIFSGIFTFYVNEIGLSVDNLNLCYILEAL